MAKRKLTYAGSGVDIAAGDEVVHRIKSHTRRTFGPRVLGKHGGFAGCFRLDYNEQLFQRNYRDPVLVSCTDGVGSKVLLAVKMGILDTIGQDCVAMNVNDLIVQGAEPLIFLDYIGIHQDKPEIVEQIVKGVADGCEIAGCSLIGGETASLPAIYKKDDFDLAGFAVGVCELKRLITGDRAQAGDIILGLTSSGVHSNGYSLVRAVIDEAKLDITKPYAALETERSLGKVLLEPTRIYARPIVSLLRKYKVKQPVVSMSHITGGGLGGNIQRTLGAHLDASVQKKTWERPAIFPFLKKHGNIDEAEMYRVFNMGVGYVVIVRPHFAEAAMDKLRQDGETVHAIGKVVKGTGRVRLR